MSNASVYKLLKNRSDKERESSREGLTSLKHNTHMSETQRQFPFEQYTYT
jgi:hypothetical protein